MKVSLTIVDKRPQPSSGTYVNTTKFEDYDRVSLVDASMSPPVLAGVLRAIANDLEGVAR
jgi:hypothetical protein